MTSTAISYSRKLQRVQIWEKLKNNYPKNKSCAHLSEDCDKQSKDKQKLADRQPALLQGTVVGIYRPLMHPLVQLTLHVYP